MPQGKQNDTPDFEKSLAELEKIVRRMEKGEMGAQSLEQTLKDFERGMVLSEQCRKSLDSARQRVEKLVAKHGGHKLEPLESDREDEADDDQEDDPDDDQDDGQMTIRTTTRMKDS